MAEEAAASDTDNVDQTEISGSDGQCDGPQQDGGSTKPKRPPRSERKRLRYERQLAERRDKRKQRKIERKEKSEEKKKQNLDEKEPDMRDKGELETERLKKQERQKMIREKLVAALATGQRICVDVSMEDSMSDKERGKLAMQIGRLYGANRHTEVPAHIYLTGFDKTKDLYKQCVSKNCGFDDYVLDLAESRHTDIFPASDIVYLSPDADRVLTTVDPKKVYVLGGLVDESITKNMTLAQSTEDGVATARLPIPEYMTKLEQQSHSQVLAINQVFEILITYIATKDWHQALAVGVPRRKGYVPKDVELS